MHKFISSLMTASLLLSSVVATAKADQLSPNSPQANLPEQPSVCEHARITFNDGSKIEADSYQHTGESITFKRKGASKTVSDKDVKQIEVVQGSCPDITVTMKTGEQIKGYRRNTACTDKNNCKTEIKQADKVVTIDESDVKLSRLKFKTTFAEKLKYAAMVPVIAFSYTALFIACEILRAKGCDEL